MEQERQKGRMGLEEERFANRAALKGTPQAKAGGSGVGRGGSGGGGGKTTKAFSATYVATLPDGQEINAQKFFYMFFDTPLQINQNRAVKSYSLLKEYLHTLHVKRAYNCQTQTENHYPSTCEMICWKVLNETFIRFHNNSSALSMYCFFLDELS